MTEEQKKKYVEELKGKNKEELISLLVGFAEGNEKMFGQLKMLNATLNKVNKFEQLVAVLSMKDKIPFSDTFISKAVQEIEKYFFHIPADNVDSEDHDTEEE